MRIEIVAEVIVLSRSLVVCDSSAFTRMMVWTEEQGVMFGADGLRLSVMLTHGRHV